MIEYTCSLIGPFWFWWGGWQKFNSYIWEPLTETGICGSDESCVVPAPTNKSSSNGDVNAKKFKTTGK